MADDLATKLANADDTVKARVEKLIDRAADTQPEPLSEKEVAAAYAALPEREQRQMSDRLRRMAERAERQAEREERRARTAERGLV